MVEITGYVEHALWLREYLLLRLTMDRLREGQAMDNAALSRFKLSLAKRKGEMFDLTP